MNDILEVDVSGGYYSVKIIGDRKNYPLVKNAEFLQLIGRFDRYHQKSMKNKSPKAVEVRYLIPSAMPMRDVKALDLIVALHNETVAISQHAVMFLEGARAHSREKF